MGIRTIEREYCTGCGLCVIACPMDVLRVDKETNCSIIEHLSDCQSCYLCERDCPEGIIKVTPDRERRIPMAW